MNPPLEQIWHEFSNKLGQFIRSRVSDPATAEDILLDVFVKIQQRLSQLQDPAKLHSWIYLIARNAVIDYYRTRKESEDISETLIDEREPGSEEPEGLKASFHRMINSLPEPYREAVVLTELEGLTQKQLAERLGISLSGAKSRVQRGRQQLKEMLLGCCRFEFDRRGGVLGCEPRSRGNCRECE